MTEYGRYSSEFLDYLTESPLPIDMSDLEKTIDGKSALFTGFSAANSEIAMLKTLDEETKRELIGEYTQETRQTFVDRYSDNPKSAENWLHDAALVDLQIKGFKRALEGHKSPFA